VSAGSVTLLPSAHPFAQNLIFCLFRSFSSQRRGYGFRTMLDVIRLQCRTGILARKASCQAFRSRTIEVHSMGLWNLTDHLKLRLNTRSHSWTACDRGAVRPTLVMQSTLHDLSPLRASQPFLCPCNIDLSPMMVRKFLPFYKNHLAIPFVNAILSRLPTTVAYTA
jgi:hypothetical protein